jgi:hypothetical protein
MWGYTFSTKPSLGNNVICIVYLLLNKNSSQLRIPIIIFVACVSTINVFLNDKGKKRKACRSSERRRRKFGIIMMIMMIYEVRSEKDRIRTSKDVERK